MKRWEKLINISVVPVFTEFPLQSFVGSLAKETGKKTNKMVKKKTLRRKYKKRLSVKKLNSIFTFYMIWFLPELNIYACFSETTYVLYLIIWLWNKYFLLSTLAKKWIQFSFKKKNKSVRKYIFNFSRHIRTHALSVTTRQIYFVTHKFIIKCQMMEKKYKTPMNTLYSYISLYVNQCNKQNRLFPNKILLVSLTS